MAKPANKSVLLPVTIRGEVPGRAMRGGAAIDNEGAFHGVLRSRSGRVLVRPTLSGLAPPLIRLPAPSPRIVTGRRVLNSGRPVPARRGSPSTR
ncbi:hypothetical protein EJ079_05575 [Mesorhizobium sp. M7A.F.Ce.TU.012.03.2.1]|nr:hypothetical protein EJ079_05575 [Mesorhizobium sp. M7A.F.Ce.TU.012.03.2.1]RWP05243.1 MAG: hypothetical protein EOQ97_22505 [Mesorhizobium sp.]